jgi:IS30 family transposase
VGKLTHEERCKIEVLHKAGVNAATIATQIGRHKSTVSRELERNSVDGIYQYNQATLLAKTRRSTCGGRSKLTEENWTYVRVLLYMKWSPEQISGWLKANPGIGFYVSDQWIYEYIRKNQFNGGDLYESLRRKGRPYRTGKFRPYRGKIKDRIAIDERPEIVEKRIRIGDWEVDSVIGKLNKSSLVTLVERVSRYTAILRVNSKEAMIVAKAIILRAQELQLPIHTMTGDNGTEFSEHKKIAEELGIDFYFTHPYSSWEKGTNENTNGLIRQYFPKGTDFNKITDEAIMTVENELNNRPRKCLNYKSPAEILTEI